MPKDNSEILLHQFRDYLEQSARTPEPLPHKLSLMSFYNEIIALKNEIKIELRYVKDGLDRYQETAELIRESSVKVDYLLKEKNFEQNHLESKILQLVFIFADIARQR